MREGVAGVAHAVLACAAVVMLGACSAHVNAFSTVPRHICAGDPVDVQWSVVGCPNVTVIPPSTALPDGPVPKEGHATIAPATNTRIALHVTRSLGNPTTSVQEIEVVTATTEPLTASLGDPATTPGCRGGKVWASVHPKRFSDEVKVSTVVSHPKDDRSYRVEHAGIRAIVSPGAVVTDFAGTPLAGDWLLTAPLGHGETCATVSPVLVVDVVTRCRPGVSDDAR
jgi:hypothetical protein